ncbi:hypothetical protein DFJ77DRAFT_446894 [Powellomyces hirtus]|nr:hypothetical protein DFJ77DRAFT_446894 [Powellomyces hirtus]
MLGVPRLLCRQSPLSRFLLSSPSRCLLLSDILFQHSHAASTSRAVENSQIQQKRKPEKHVRNSRAEQQRPLQRKPEQQVAKPSSTGRNLRAQQQRQQQENFKDVIRVLRSVGGPVVRWIAKRILNRRLKHHAIEAAEMWKQYAMTPALLNGTEYHILGTEHDNALSARHTRELIETLRPDCVAIEQSSQMGGTIEKELDVYTTIERRSFGIPLLRRILGVYYLFRLRHPFLANMITTGYFKGAEFFEAVRAAGNVSARVVYADQPMFDIKVAFEATGQLRFSKEYLQGLDRTTMMLLSFCHPPLDGHAAKLLVGSMGPGPEFAFSSKPLTDTRDPYLRKCMVAAGRGKKKVLLVTGRAHVNGIMRNLKFVHHDAILPPVPVRPARPDRPRIVDEIKKE